MVAEGMGGRRRGAVGRRAACPHVPPATCGAWCGGGLSADARATQRGSASGRCRRRLQFCVTTDGRMPPSRGCLHQDLSCAGGKNAVRATPGRAPATNYSHAAPPSGRRTAANYKKIFCCAAIAWKIPANRNNQPSPTTHNNNNSNKMQNAALLTTCKSAPGPTFKSGPGPVLAKPQYSLAAGPLHTSEAVADVHQHSDPSGPTKFANANNAASSDSEPSRLACADTEAGLHARASSPLDSAANCSRARALSPLLLSGPLQLTFPGASRDAHW
eukprot:366506-Chlamydomonas_euryale.AAC.8